MKHAILLASSNLFVAKICRPILVTRPCRHSSITTIAKCQKRSLVVESSKRRNWFLLVIKIWALSPFQMHVLLDFQGVALHYGNLEVLEWVSNVRWSPGTESSRLNIVRPQVLRKRVDLTGPGLPPQNSFGRIQAYIWNWDIADVLKLHEELFVFEC